MNINIPMLPPKELSPNYNPKRPHWAVKRRAAEEFKDTACMVAKIELLWYKANGGAWQPIPRATIQPIFYVSSHRKRDPDNWLAMLKPAIDGLVDTGLLIDDDSEHVELLTPVFVVDKARAPMTVLEVREIGWREARGALSWPDGELPADIVGRLRGRENESALI